MKISDFKQINAFAYAVMRQSNTRHLSWMKQFTGRLQSEIVTPLGASVPALMSQAIQQMASTSNHEDECYIIITKSELTPQIAELDKTRDTKFVGSKAMADALSRIGSTEQQQAAKDYLDLCAHYKIDTQERYDDQTTKMDQLFQVLLSSAWTARLQALGLTATINELAEINRQMKQLIEQRNNEMATITPQAMLLARQAADEAFQLCCSVINAFAIAQWNAGSSPFDQAIARINQDQSYYEKNVFAQAKGGSSSGQGDDTPDNGGTTPDNGGDTPQPDNGGGDTPTPNPDPVYPQPDNGGGDNPGGGGDDPGADED